MPTAGDGRACAGLDARRAGAAHLHPSAPPPPRCSALRLGRCLLEGSRAAKRQSGMLTGKESGACVPACAEP